MSKICTLHEKIKLSYTLGGERGWIGSVVENNSLSVVFSIRPYPVSADKAANRCRCSLASCACQSRCKLWRLNNRVWWSLLTSCIRRHTLPLFTRRFQQTRCSNAGTRGADSVQRGQIFQLQERTPRTRRLRIFHLKKIRLCRPCHRFRVFANLFWLSGSLEVTITLHLPW